MKLLRIQKPIECRILKRVNRFVLEVEIDGTVRRARLTNTGRIEDLFRGNVGICIKN